MDAFLTYLYDPRALVLILVGVSIGLVIARVLAKREESKRIEIMNFSDDNMVDLPYLFEKWGVGK